MCVYLKLPSFPILNRQQKRIGFLSSSPIFFPTTSASAYYSPRVCSCLRLRSLIAWEKSRTERKLVADPATFRAAAAVVPPSFCPVCVYVLYILYIFLLGFLYFCWLLFCGRERRSSATFGAGNRRLAADH